MPEQGWVQQACARGRKILTDYPKNQVRYLAGPDKFIGGLSIETWQTITDAFAILTIGGGLALLINTINISLYDERIRRVVELHDQAENKVFLLVAVCMFTIFCFISFKFCGGRASFVATGVVLMYGIGFTAPVITLICVLLTHLASFLLDATIVVMPPMKITRLSDPDPRVFSVIVTGAYSIILFFLNIYLAYIFWLTLRTINQISRWRGVTGIIAAIAPLYILGGWLDYLADRIVELLKPVLDFLP